MVRAHARSFSAAECPLQSCVIENRLRPDCDAGATKRPHANQAATYACWRPPWSSMGNRGSDKKNFRPAEQVSSYPYGAVVSMKKSRKTFIKSFRASDDKYSGTRVLADPLIKSGMRTYAPGAFATVENQDVADAHEQRLVAAVLIGTILTYDRRVLSWLLKSRSAGAPPRIDLAGIAPHAPSRRQSDLEERYRPGATRALSRAPARRIPVREGM